MGNWSDFHKNTSEGFLVPRPLFPSDRIFNPGATEEASVPRERYYKSWFLRFQA